MPYGIGRWLLWDDRGLLWEGRSSCWDGRVTDAGSFETDAGSDLPVCALPVVGSAVSTRICYVDSLSSRVFGRWTGVIAISSAISRAICELCSVVRGDGGDFI